MQWQSIETAPKDGTWVDLWCVPRFDASPGRMTNMSWSEGAWRLPSFLSNGSAGQAIDMEATHWMALPAKPSAAGIDERAQFARYLQECDELSIVPDVAGAFHWAFEAASAIPQAKV